MSKGVRVINVDQYNMQRNRVMESIEEVMDFAIAPDQCQFLPDCCAVCIHYYFRPYHMETSSILDSLEYNNSSDKDPEEGVCTVSTNINQCDDDIIFPQQYTYFFKICANFQRRSCEDYYKR